MKLSPATLLLSLSLFSLSLQTAQAALVTADIAYDNAGRSNTMDQRSQSLTRSGTDVVELNSRVDFSDMSRNAPNVKATADHGSMSTYTSLHLGGIGKGVISWQDSITNASGAAQNYQMNISLTDLEFGFAPVAGSSHFISGYRADVLVNGFSVWHSSQMIHVRDNNQVSIDKQGFDIGAATDRDASEEFYSFGIDDYVGKVDLGSFAAGQTATVTYQLTSLVSWDAPDACADMECGRYVRAGISDPFGIQAGNRVVVAVPEADTWAMLLGGLGLLGLIARRRRQN